ncbi:MAG: hypothetical protein ACPGVB_01670, partial [Chitinophagales bacterium]
KMEFWATIAFYLIIFYLIDWFFEGYNNPDLKQKQGIFSAKRSNKKEQTTETYRISTITETNVTYESNSSELRTIDNSRSNGIVRRRLIISREWKKTISLQEEDYNRSTKKAKIGLSFLGLEGELEEAIQTKYNFTRQETKIFSEEVELEVGPSSKIVLRIDWKTIWQNGIIELENPTGDIIFFPYKIAKGITFDQHQEKVN